MTVVWVSCSFDFYLIGYEVKYFPGSLDLNQLASLTAELLGYLSAGFLLTRWKAKLLFLVSFSMSAVAGTVIVIMGRRAEHFFVVLVLLAKFGVTGAFGAVYVAHPRMFPTLFSITSMGFANFAARFATVFSPMIAEVEEPVPMAVFTALCIASALCSLCLKESKD